MIHLIYIYIILGILLYIHMEDNIGLSGILKILGFATLIIPLTIGISLQMWSIRLFNYFLIADYYYFCKGRYNNLTAERYLKIVKVRNVLSKTKSRTCKKRVKFIEEKVMLNYPQYPDNYTIENSEEYI